MRRFSNLVRYCFLYGVLAVLPACAVGVAKYVTAEEITGLVVDADTGKPLPGAVVAIRYERFNTGHSSPHCFRSMAVETDAAGRFRFVPWKQEDTLANTTFGQVTAYKGGYAVPWRSVIVKQEKRSVGGIAYSDTIKVPKTELRLELKPFSGTDEERIEQLRRTVAEFTCRWGAEFDDMVLLYKIRDEIMSSPISDITPRGWDATVSRWIDAVMVSKSRTK